MWFTKLIKQFFFWIDKIVYNFIPEIYDLLLDIARTSILTQADIADMADRIYKLLAIFMVFKVTLSLITYVVNPDDFSDKSKGVAKLGTNIVISLSLLILTPYIFNYAYQLQTIVLEDNSLAALIFGDDLGGESFLNTAGDEMSYISIQAFFSPNLSLGNLHECTTLYETVYDDAGKPDGKKMNPLCLDALKALPTDNFSSTTLQNYVAGVENSSLGLMFRQDMALATAEIDGEEEFIMDYKFIFSTVVGVVIILLLITFCMDVAVRSLKLAFFQLIAPIPILSYVDPKSGKDGLFKKWYEMCFKTFLSLFIRLLALYFAVYIISKVGNMKLVDIIDGSYRSGFLLSVFIIIGALMFAKQLPEILKGLGIKLDGDGKFTLNPLRKLEKQALGGGMLKKPNDALAKFGKGVLKSPFTGASLGARKLIAGADSAAHGKGFRNGTKNVKGKLAQSYDKFIEKNLPHTSKAIKAKKEGRDEVSLMHSKWTKGDKAAQRLGGDHDFKKLDGKDSNRDAYKAAGFSGEFLESKMNLDRETEKRKIYQRIYNARQMGKSADDIIAEEGDNLRAYGINESDIRSETKLSQKLENQNKTVSGLEKVHESMRKVDNDQAELEDAIKFRKYNKIDPTNVRGTSSNSSVGGSSSTTGGTSSSSSAPSPAPSGTPSSAPSGAPSPSTSGTPSSAPSGAPSPSTSGAPSPSTSGAPSPSTSGAPSTASGGTSRIAPGPVPNQTTSSTSGHDSEEVVDAEKERARNIHEYEIEKLKQQIEEIEKELEERKETINRTISNFEKVIESLKDQKMNPVDTASKEVIERELDNYTNLVEKEKANLKQIEDDYNEKIRYLEERIRLLTNGV